MNASPGVSVDLRDRGRVTGLLVLRELAFHPASSLRGVAERLGVTVQAVSVHARKLAAAGLLERTGQAYAPTPRGVQALHEGFGDLKRSVDETIARMAVVRVTSAVAATAVEAGDEVGLFMEGGQLVARAGRRAASTGRALNDAAVGDEVQLRDLAGVVDLRPGRLVVLRVPSPEEGGSRAVSVRRTKALLREKVVAADRVAALGTPAVVLARRLGLTVDFAFAPVEAAFHAAELGVPTLLLASRENVKDALVVLDARNQRTLERIPIEILDCPEGER